MLKEKEESVTFLYSFLKRMFSGGSEGLHLKNILIERLVKLSVGENVLFRNCPVGT